MMSTVYTDRIRVVLGAMHLLSLAVVVLAIRRGVFAWNLKALFKAVLVSVLAIVIALVTVRAYLGSAMHVPYTGDAALVEFRVRRVVVHVAEHVPLDVGNLESVWDGFGADGLELLGVRYVESDFTDDGHRGGNLLT